MKKIGMLIHQFPVETDYLTFVLCRFFVSTELGTAFQW